MINTSTSSYVNAKRMEIDSTEKVKTSLMELPIDIHSLILSFFSPKEFACTISLVRKNITWMQNDLQNGYWKEQFSKNFGEEPSIDMLWKERFKQALQMFSSLLETKSKLFQQMGGSIQGPKILVTINDKKNKKIVPIQIFNRMNFNLVFDEKTLSLKKQDQLKINDIYIPIVLDQINYRIAAILWDARIRIKFGIPVIMTTPSEGQFIPEEKSDVIEKLITIEKRINCKLNAMVKEAKAHNLQLLNKTKGTGEFLPFEKGIRFYCNSLGKLTNFEEESKSQKEKIVRYYGFTENRLDTSFIQWSIDETTPIETPDPIFLNNLIGENTLKKALQVNLFVSALSQTAKIMSRQLSPNITNVEETEVDVSTELTQNEHQWSQFHAPISISETWFRKNNIWKSSKGEK